MATRNMGYDHPAYQAVLPMNMNMATGALLTGNAGATAKYVAFTSLLIKSIQVAATTLSTSVDSLLLYRITNNGTTAVNTVTATYTMGTLGSAAYVANLTPGAVSTSGTLGSNPVGGAGTPIPLLQGDTFYLVKGTDATAVLAVQAEIGLLPLANVTA
jgi:hypothetical protein